MKVSVIVEQTKEYERLQGLIDNIERALKDFEKTKTSDPSSSFSMGIVSMNGWVIGVDPTEEKIETVDVELGSEVSKLIKYDMMNLLRNHLSILKEQQSALEV